MKTIEDRVREILQTHAEISVARDDIGSDDNLIEFGINSVTFIKLIVALEIEFDSEFDDSLLDINQFPTIKSLVTYLEAL